MLLGSALLLRCVSLRLGPKRGEPLKLLTYSVDGGEPRVGSLEGEEIRPLAHEDMIEFIEYGGSPEPGEDTVPLGKARIHAPVTRPQKVIGIGLNYEDELALVIGRAARNVSESEAPGYVFGYTNANDVSSRDLQFSEGGQWTRSKSIDTFCPIGPYIATRDEIEDPQDLSIRCILNGEIMQDGTTSKMIFSVAELVSFLSQGMTLLPGDVIVTGTPPGVGSARDPQVWLKSGDEVTIEIEGLGSLTNPVETD